jgi:hypothetical protein
MADNLLPGDRTVKNELGRMANYKRNILKKTLINAAEDKRLSISPDNWTDNLAEYHTWGQQHTLSTNSWCTIR